MGLSAKEAYLIDVLAFDDLTPLRPILENQAIVKILHDASQDLGLIAKATKATPKNIFDVKLAARLLGMGTNYSLSELVQNLCGVHLSKGQQRSNWLRRPLKPAQIKYAERDVLYLHQIREVLLSEANQVQRTTWLEQEMCNFNDPELYLPPSPAERLLRSPATRKLSPQQCAVVAAIADWRTDAALINWHLTQESCYVTKKFYGWPNSDAQNPAMFEVPPLHCLAAMNLRLQA